MMTKNILSQGNLQEYFEVKTIKYHDFNFDTSQNAYIIPYQLAGFWTGIYNATEANDNNTIQEMRRKNAGSVGVTWIGGDIVFEVFAVQRQRLLENGPTTILTYDLDATQNVVIGIADRKIETIIVTDASSLSPTALQTVNTRLFNRDLDHYTKKEVPVKFKYTHHVDMNVLHHNYMWLPNDLEPEDDFNVLIPGAQGITNNAGTTITNATEIIQTTQTENNIITNQTTIQNRRSYPRLHVGQPEIPDETGTMKWRYQIRISTRLKLLFHKRPDYADTFTLSAIRRQSIPLPRATGTIPYLVPCVPYEINT